MEKPKISRYNAQMMLKLTNSVLKKKNLSKEKINRLNEIKRQLEEIIKYYDSI